VARQFQSYTRPVKRAAIPDIRNGLANVYPPECRSFCHLITAEQFERHLGRTPGYEGGRMLFIGLGNFTLAAAVTCL